MTLWEMGLWGAVAVHLDKAAKTIGIFKMLRHQLTKAGTIKEQTHHLQKKTQRCLVWKK